MARPTLAQIKAGLAGLEAGPDPEDLLAILVAAENPDGTPYSLPVDPIDRVARLLGRISVGVADSLQAAGEVTAPAAGAAIATLAAPPVGVYDVVLDVWLSAAAAADASNMKLQRGGADLFSPLFVVNNPIEHRYRITLNGSQNLSVVAIAAGGAGVVYCAQITATRIE